MSNLKKKIQNLLQAAEYRKKTDTKEAIKILQEATQLLPNLHVNNDQDDKEGQIPEISYLSKRGNILYEMKKYKEANTCYLAIKTELPQNAQIYKAIGDCLYNQGEYDEAIEEYKTGLMIHEDNFSLTSSDMAALLNSKGLAYIELKEYTKALADFETAITINGKNPFYHCNKGHAAFALSDRATALKHFKQAKELVKSNNLGDRIINNADYIEKTLKEFIENLESLDKVSRAKSNTIILNQEINFVKVFIKALPGIDEERDDEEDDENDEDITANRKGNFAGSRRKAVDKIDDEVIEHQEEKAFTQILDAKAKLNFIQEDSQLYEFYDGFMFTLHRSYVTAVVINSGALPMDKGSKIDSLAKAIALLPLVGEQVSEGINDLNNFMKEARVIKAASNICKFATTSAQFDEIAQDVTCNVVLERQNKIKAFKESDLEKNILPRWASRFQSVVDQIVEAKCPVDSMLYGERNETPLQKLGYQEAVTLVYDFIASGNIYEGAPAMRIPPSEKGKKFIDIAVKQLDSIEERRAAIVQGKNKGTKGLEKKKGGFWSWQVEKDSVNK